MRIYFRWVCLNMVFLSLAPKQPSKEGYFGLFAEVLIQSRRHAPDNSTPQLQILRQTRILMRFVDLATNHRSHSLVGQPAGRRQPVGTPKFDNIDLNLFPGNTFQNICRGASADNSMFFAPIRPFGKFSIILHYRGPIYQLYQLQNNQSHTDHR